MDTNFYLVEIAKRFAPANRPEFATLFVAVLHELLKGRPVAPRTLALALAWPVEQVIAVFERTQEVEYDDAGDIVGYAITLRETAHAFEIGSERLSHGVRSTHQFFRLAW